MKRRIGWFVLGWFAFVCGTAAVCYLGFQKPEWWTVFLMISVPVTCYLIAAAAVIKGTDY